MSPELYASQPNAITAALEWLESVTVGSIAISIAIIAVAWFGLMLMAGRLRTRRAIEIIFACFIIFGASTIASGIVRGFGDTMPNGAIAPQAPPLLVAPIAAQPARRRSPYDPYAGAALPPRR